MKQLRIAFIGGGNMAEALIAGLIRAGHAAGNIAVTDIQPQRLDYLRQRYEVTTGADAATVAREADVVVMAVKPQHMEQAVAGVGGCLRQDATLVSIAAGVSVASIMNWLGRQVSVVRVMPNMPCLLGAGMSVLYADALVPDGQRRRAEYVLSSSGDTAWLEDEDLMHAVTAISGSGPAYFFLLAEIMQGAAMGLGLTHELAGRLVRQTALGAGRMMVESGAELAGLRQQVTSPGGTTQAALDCMHDGGLTDAVRMGVQAAARRSRELG